MIVTMQIFFAMSHNSFTLSRPGLKPGYYVPLRLRIVDTVTVFMGIPIVIATICVTMLSFKYAALLGMGIIWKNELIFVGYGLFVMFIVSWAFYLISVPLFSVIFQYFGMLTKDESKYYPLKTYKGGIVDHWPEEWQKPYSNLSSQL